MRTRPLAELSARDLRPLLAEESEHWGGELFWDYADVSAAVASGLERGALSGLVLQDGPHCVAYCYYMLDGGRAIVGSVFAAEGFRGRRLEEGLLREVLAEAQGHEGPERVECQTLFSTAASAEDLFARAGFQSRSRHYLVRLLSERVETAPRAWRLRPVRREDLATAAHIIHRSHQGSAGRNRQPDKVFAVRLARILGNRILLHVETRQPDGPTQQEQKRDEVAGIE